MLLRPRFTRLFSTRRTLRSRRTACARRHEAAAWIGRVEALEDRTLLSTFFVTNTADAGAGSLRQAILDANASDSADTIVFNIPPTDPGFEDVDSTMPGGDPAPDVFVIRPLSQLPRLIDLTGGTTIDGRTQTAFGGDTNPFGPEIVLDGSLITTILPAGLDIRSNDNAVLGLNIQRFRGNGLQVVGGDRNWIAANYIGTDATGTLSRANNRDGILLFTSADGNVIGTNADGVGDSGEGNLISGNGSSAIRITRSDENVVAGNYIGLDRTGSSAVPNSSGISVSGSRNRIGTNGDGVADLAERNVISANRATAV
ncbi:MAG TPA: hypothetical protein VML55_14220, partial [Planctomycetaceae bacterium]|nr:hypothetical protein [Planctomycetaceae bacterium]